MTFGLIFMGIAAARWIFAGVQGGVFAVGGARLGGAVLETLALESDVSRGAGPPGAVLVHRGGGCTSESSSVKSIA